MGLPQFNDTRDVLGQNLTNIPIEMLDILRKSERCRRRSDNKLFNLLFGICVGPNVFNMDNIDCVPSTCKATSIYLRL